MENSSSNIYNEEEIETLGFIKKVRVDALKEMVKEGPTTHTGTNRCINEIATSLEKGINDTANSRLKHQDTKDKGAVMDLVAATLSAISSKKEPVTNRELAIPSYIDVEITVPGQTDINPEQLSVDDFTNNE